MHLLFFSFHSWANVMINIGFCFTCVFAKIYKMSTIHSFPGSPGAVEGKLGKNRTEADMRRYIDERYRLEKEREEVRSSLANLKKERREIKEELGASQGTSFSLPVAHCCADYTLICVSVVLRPQATGLIRSPFEAEGGGMSGGRTAQGRGGATPGRG